MRKASKGKVNELINERVRLKFKQLWNPAKLEQVYKFNDSFNSDDNALFLYDGKKLYTASVLDGGGIYGEANVTVENAPEKCFTEISIKEAIEWFILLERFSTQGAEGTMVPVLKMVVRKMRD